MNQLQHQYLMEDPREAHRLQAKVDATAWAQRYLAPHLKPNAKVVEVGCGAGHLIRAASQLHPTTHFLGIDSSQERIQLARSHPAEPELTSNIEYRVGNAYALPLQEASVDLVYSRFLLQYLAEPQQAIQEMVRVLKPGGRLLLQDLDGQLLWHYPPDQELMTGIEKILNCFAQTGFDPYVGRKLYSMAYQASLSDLTVTAESYHLYAGTISDEALGLWQTKLDIAAQAASQHFATEEIRSLQSRFLDYLRRKDTLTYSVVFTVTGCRA